MIILEGLRQAGLMLWQTLWALVAGFGLSGAVQAFASRSAMEHRLGRLTPGSAARATVLGAVSSSCSYAASAMARALYRGGADFGVAMIFMIASTNVVIELGIVLWLLIGWQFAVAEYVGGAAMIGLFAVLARLFLPSHRGTAADAETTADAAPPTDGLRRIRTLGGWVDAAGYALSDMRMLRREMVIGYGVAGLLTVLLPAAVWHAVFLTGHGGWTVVENVVIGPLIACLSFVCSIGNIPLAAALWRGGISFGGVISFIFGDLLTLPLLLIYRRFYGWRVTVRLAACLWCVMSLAGLAVGGLASLLHLAPTSHTAHALGPPLALNATAVLNVVALLLLGGMLVLASHRRQWGSARYVTDPVCGMQVDRETAPAVAVLAGQEHHFCSERCRDRFLASGSGGGGPQGAVTPSDTADVADAAVAPATPSTMRR